MSHQMTPRERFFWLHAGYNHDPKTETRAQGRRRCAAELARAEVFAESAGWTFEWVGDDGVTADELNHDEWCRPDCGIEHSAWGCVCKTDRHVLASLWGIIDPSPDYCRVVQAELAGEAEADIEESLTNV